ncbi:amino acid ABC transporter substrate-binding protein [Silicimonas algicola]|nr:amino acid ABC transporter substrate-binding protein [Silicimonas algicola]AZQ66708.1 amino acid ABC transporter substrate-binding protein [Silicimonas algicola]
MALPVWADDKARIAYLGIEGDPFYEPQPFYTGLSLKDIHRPIEGARLAFRDARVLGRALGVEFNLEEVLAPPGDAAAALETLRSQHPLAILLDLPSDQMQAVLEASAETDLFINIRDPANYWREAGCAPGLLHTVPSHAMLSDALAQHLRAQGWDEVLLLHGPTQGDTERADAVRKSAAKFGLEIVDDRAFELTNDPRRRDRSNMLLLTGGVRHDVIWLIDEQGDFGRYLPFATHDARPVVGSEGLTPMAWHWTFERYGAPQLNQRFRRITDRDMSSEDWAGWAAVRAIMDAASAVRGTDPVAVKAALRSDKLAIDLYKGVRGNFRDWDGQLRQPILLATHNAVIAVAPVEGFEHQFDTLDTLGPDRSESKCSR